MDIFLVLVREGSDSCMSLTVWVGEEEQADAELVNSR